MGAQKKHVFILFIVLACVLLSSLIVIPNFNFRPEKRQINDFDTYANAVLDMIADYQDLDPQPLTLKNTDNQFIRPFETKRLIIQSNDKINDQGAIRTVEYQNLHIHQYLTEQAAYDAYQYYIAQPNIDWVDVDTIITLEGLQDSFSYKTWGAKSMGAPVISNAMIDLYGVGNLPETIVAVIDTGIDTDHEWFEGRIRHDLGANYSLTNTSPTGYGYEDTDGHGTHVSGIICDLTLSNVKIMPVKVFNGDGHTYALQVSLAVNYIIECKNQGHNIVAMNLSLGGKSSTGIFGNYTYYNNSLNNAYNNGILPIVAAGNENDDAINHSPANIENAITVAAVGVSGSEFYKASYSNYGSVIDLCAPGDYILSAKVGGGTTYMSGTSMATPHVAGAVALLASDPNKNYTAQEYEALLKDNVIDLGEPGRDDTFGAGLVNLEHIYSNELGTYIISATSEGEGLISPSGNISVLATTSKTFIFTAALGYEITSIIVDDVSLAGTDLTDAIENGYKFDTVDSNHKIHVVFSGRSDIYYTVNHYKQSLLGYFDLYKTEILYGETNQYTAAQTINLPGFTAQNFQQKLIKANGTSVIDIYYLRNTYTLTLTNGEGIETTTGSGSYLYETPITINSELIQGYQFMAWVNNETKISLNQEYTFTMPDHDLDLIATAEIQKFTITTIVGEHGKITPENPTVNYSQSQQFNFTADEDYQVADVLIDGSSVGKCDYYTIYNIKAPHTVKVLFEKSNREVVTDLPVQNDQPKSTKKVLKYFLLGIISMAGGTGLVFCIAMPIYLHHKKQLKHEIKKTRLVHVYSDQLFDAIDYVRAHEIEFITFCRENKLDYHADYRDCIVKFYQTQVKSN